MLADWCSQRSAAYPPGIAEEDFEELEGTHLRPDARLGPAGGNRHGTVRLRPGSTALRYEPLCAPQRQQGDGRGAADDERSASYRGRSQRGIRAGCRDPRADGHRRYKASARSVQTRREDVEFPERRYLQRMEQNGHHYSRNGGRLGRG